MDDSQRVSQIYYRFYDNGRPSKEEFIEFYIHIIFISLIEEEYLLIYGEQYLTQLNHLPL